MRDYLQRLWSIWCEPHAGQNTRCKRLKWACGRTAQLKPPVLCAALTQFVFLMMVVALVLWYTQRHVIDPRGPAVRTGERLDHMLRVEVDKPTVGYRGSEQARKAPWRHAPAWLADEEASWHPEDRASFQASLHRGLSPKALESTTQGHFHASQMYQPWTLPAVVRTPLFSQLKSHLKSHPEDCAVAAPHFRVYVNLIVVRWASLSSLETWDPENEWVFLRNIHVTPLAHEARLPTSELVWEHNNMCPVGTDRYSPTVRHEHVLLTSNELPWGVMLSGDEALCAQHFAEVFQGVWPCNEDTWLPREQLNFRAA